MIYKISSLHFVSKAFTVCNYNSYKSYKRLIEYLAKISFKNPKNIYGEKFLNPFIDMFLSSNGSNCYQSCKIYGFDSTKVSDLCKSNFSLFYLENDLFNTFCSASEEKNVFIKRVLELFECFKNGIKEFREKLSQNNSFPKSFINDQITQLQNDLDGIAISEKDFDCFQNNLSSDDIKNSGHIFSNLKEKIVSLKGKIKEIENSYFIFSNTDDKESYSKYKEAYQHYNELWDLLSFLEMTFRYVEQKHVFESNGNSGFVYRDIVTFILISKRGVANIGFIFPSCFKIINSSKETITEKNMSDIAHQICAKTNQLASLYSIIDNTYEKSRFSFLNNTIFNEFTMKKEEPTRKAVYLNFLFDKNKKEKYDASGNSGLELKEIFDYISLAAAYEHTFTSKYLYDYAKKVNSNLLEKNNKRIIEYGNNETEHIYYDDNLFMCSVINPAFILNNYPESNALGVFKVSHLSKMYSLWNFQYICEAISHGSIAICIFKMFIRICTYKLRNCHLKLRNLYLYHKVTKIAADLLKEFDLNTFPTKNGAFDLSKIVFDNLHATEIVDSLSNLLDNGWKDGNLLTSQSYNRYGLFLSIGSLLVSLFSFGMISKIYVDGYIINDVNYINKPGKSWASLVWDAFNTPKMWLVTLICFLPFIVFVIIQFIERQQYKNFNITKEYKRIFKQ